MKSSWGLFTLKNVVLMVIISQVYSQEKPNGPEQNTESFMPSYKVLFRRSDTEGELLLPSIPPFVGNLQTSESNINNNYEPKPTYASAQPKPTCLLRTCDQYVTGRDLTYERALEIVQNEEYLVAVDADLIRRRQDYGYGLRPAESQAIQWSLPLHDHLPLTQYIATSGKKKREAEYNPDDLSSGSKKKREAEFNVDDLALQSRIFNVSAVSYSSDDLVWQYLRYGAATALLLGLAATLPSPDSPILPINLPSNSKSDDDFDDIEQSIKQTYQADRIDRLMVPNSSPIPSDKVLSKRQLLDVLLPFRRKSAKRPSKRPLERPAKRPGNRPKRLPKPKPSVLPRPATERIPVSLKVEDDPLVETLEEESTAAIEFESGRNPLLSDQDFNKFFPSWSRKKRATLIQESRLFNVTGLGFGTISYPWTDVIGTYIKYALTGGLILALTTFIQAPTTPVVPFSLPELPETFLPSGILPKLNTVDLPPNVPEGFVPPGNPLPGTPAGGAKPVGNTPEAAEAIALIPRGSIPVAVFPQYISERTVPAVSVIFLETPTPSLVKRQGIWDSVGSGFNNWARDYNCLKSKLFRKKRDTGYGAPDCDYNHLRYGFRTRVSLVENQSCILDVTCTATGNRINVALARKSNSGFGRKQLSLEEFSSDAPPDCRAIRDPSDSCLSLY